MYFFLICGKKCILAYLGSGDTCTSAQLAHKMTLGLLFIDATYKL
jgi:hypothetical protein